jgi:hypothetical protein
MTLGGCDVTGEVSALAPGLSVDDAAVSEDKGKPVALTHAPYTSPGAV